MPSIPTMLPSSLEGRQMDVIFLLMVLALFGLSYGLVQFLARLGDFRIGDAHKGERP